MDGRNDTTALLTSKGQSTRAARDIIGRIAQSGEPVQVFCLHDFDAAGTMIAQTVREGTRNRGWDVDVENLGLDEEEAMELVDEETLQVEEFTYGKPQPVADYVSTERKKWLQTHRIELNAFTTKEFIEWLDGKMAQYAGKVVPPPDVMSDRLNDQVRQRLRDSIVARVLSEARIDDQVDQAASALSAKTSEVAAKLPNSVPGDLQVNPQRHWTDVVDDVARNLSQGIA